MYYCPLVSVRILTYNSAKYIVEALESVKNQTYNKIELIVSDDCSKDDTVEVCREWLAENKDRFVNTTLLTVEKNTGTSANCNRSLSVCKGDWLKGCAGDDALLPNCIEKFVEYINLHNEAKLVVGWAKEYRNTFDEENEIDYHVKKYNGNMMLKQPVEVQFKNILHGDSWIFTPAVFYNVEMLRTLGGWDEKYGVHEDFPLFFKILRNGFKCYELEEYVVKYRSSDTNVWGNVNQIFNYKHMKNDFQIKKDLCFQYYTRREKISSYTTYFTLSIMNKLGLVKRTWFNRLVYTFLNFIFAIITLDFKGVRTCCGSFYYILFKEKK